jgi:hypothetical protein
MPNSRLAAPQGIDGNLVAKITGKALALLHRRHPEVEAVPVAAEVSARPVKLSAHARFRAPAEATAKAIGLERRQLVPFRGMAAPSALRCKPSTGVPASIATSLKWPLLLSALR